MPIPLPTLSTLYISFISHPLTRYFVLSLRMLRDADVESRAEQDRSQPRGQRGAGLQGVQQAGHVLLAERWQGEDVLAYLHLFLLDIPLSVVTFTPLY